MYYGFPMAGKCIINRDCKVGAIKQYFKDKDMHQIVQYIGIATDEPKRLQKLKDTNKVSLLAKYGYTEEMAREKCKEYGLLSPIYETGTRGGCWFCPNCRMKTLADFKVNHPDLWEDLGRLSLTPNLCSYGFKYGKTFQEIDRKIDIINAQAKIWNE
jgi:hypothetical protein